MGARHTEIRAPVWCAASGQSANYTSTFLTEAKYYRVGLIPTTQNARVTGHMTYVFRPATLYSVEQFQAESAVAKACTNGLIHVTHIAGSGEESGRCFLLGPKLLHTHKFITKCFVFMSALDQYRCCL